MAVKGRIDFGPKVEVVVVDHDPTTTATDTTIGSLIVDFSTGKHYRKLDNGSTTNVTPEIGLKDNLSATTDPATTEDNTEDYAVGSRWVNVSSDEAFIAVDVSTGAAVWKSITSIGGSLTASNKDMAASATTADEQAATATTVVSTPIGDGYVQVSVNGHAVSVAEGPAKDKDCYFADPGTPGTAKPIADIVAGDSCRWKGSIAGYQLATTDRIDFLYVT